MLGDFSNIENVENAFKYVRLRTLLYVETFPFRWYDSIEIIFFALVSWRISFGSGKRIPIHVLTPTHYKEAMSMSTCFMVLLREVLLLMHILNEYTFNNVHGVPSNEMHLTSCWNRAHVTLGRGCLSSWCLYVVEDFVCNSHRLSTCITFECIVKIVRCTYLYQADTRTYINIGISHVSEATWCLQSKAWYMIHLCRTLHP